MKERWNAWVNTCTFRQVVTTIADHLPRGKGPVVMFVPGNWEWDILYYGNRLRLFHERRKDLFIDVDVVRFMYHDHEDITEIWLRHGP